jgi:outer membrane protein insertion porin family
MKSQKDRVFNIPVLNADVKRIGELYAEQGYTFSGVTNMDVQEQGEIIKIDITEGKLEDVKIEGKHRTKDYVILKQLDVKKGEIFNSTKVMKSFQKIFNLGFFETVKPKYDKGVINPSDVILTIQIKEQKTGTASLGGGYSSANGFVGYLEVSQNNFRGRAQKLKVKLEMGGITTYELGFYDPYFRKNTSLGLSVYKTDIEREYISGGRVIGLYEERRAGFTLSTGHPVGDRTRLSFKFRDEDIEVEPHPNFYTVDKTTADLLAATSDHIQVFSGTLTKDTRNNYLNPNAGRLDSLTVSTTGGLFRGKNQYTKYVGKLQRYYGTSKRAVMAFRLITGFTSVSGDDQLPVYEEYNVGGANTLRGYRTNEFSGRKTLLLNTEYRHAFNKNFTGVLFVDGGDAWGIDPALKTVLSPSRDDFDVKWTAGVGIRFHSPVGPIRLDYGKPISDSDNSGESYFSMGSLF